MLEVASRALAYTQKETTDQTQDPNSSKEIIGNAPAMQEVFRAIGRLSQSAITVLISGQSGSGKELVARALHQHSPRATAPFVALNMAAIPKDLMESELFGHEKGSFTGAAGSARAALSRRMAAHYFSMKSATCPMRPKQGYFEYLLRASSSALAEPQLSRQMSGLSLQPIRTLEDSSPRAHSARTCITGSTLLA